MSVRLDLELVERAMENRPKELFGLSVPSDLGEVRGIDALGA